jgi:hypothetical protein
MRAHPMSRRLAIGVPLALLLVLLWAASGCGAASASAASGSSGAAATTQAPAAPAAATGQIVHQAMTIKTGKMVGKPGWPQYTNAAWSAKAGDTVVLTITSYDDGTAPLPAGSPYGKVQGTVNGTELVDGQAVQSIPVAQVAHTFTVPALGINLVIPAAPKGGTITVQATIHVTKAGVYTWQCESPCGTGSTGWEGPMVTKGWMTGAITVEA